MATVYDIHTRQPQSKLHQPTLANPGMNRDKAMRQLSELDFDINVLGMAADSAALNEADHNLITLLYDVRTRMERAATALRILLQDSKPPYPFIAPAPMKG